MSRLCHFESFIDKGLFFIKRVTWKFIRSFACVDSDMAEAKLPLSFNVAPQKNGRTRRRLIYN
jgi:hypothetical protein